MKTILFLVALSTAGAAIAGKRIETCENAELVPGKGWVYTPVKCAVEPGEAAKEKACGKDFGELRVGMSVKRFEQCNEALSLESESVTSAGRTEVYLSTFYWIQARNGKIVGYTRRTN